MEVGSKIFGNPQRTRKVGEVKNHCSSGLVRSAGGVQTYRQQRIPVVIHGRGPAPRSRRRSSVIDSRQPSTWSP